MASLTCFFVGLLTLLYVLNVHSHLCLISPAQRGEMDISKSGSDTCFRHGAPCGGVEPGQRPYESVIGGKQYYIKWQQNFNHYTVGYPGYMDIAVAPVNNENWQLLAFASDEYMYAQDNQQNYSSFVVLPNIDCPHCIIRARYNSHKPGEQTFYQCADIEIKHSENGKEDSTYNIVRQKHYHDFSNSLKVAANSYVPDSDLVFRGFAYSPFDNDVLYIVKVDMDGKVTPYGQFSFKVDLHVDPELRLGNVQRHRKFNFKKADSKKFEDVEVNRMFILDSIATVNEKNNLVTLYHGDTSMDIPANRIVEFDSVSGQIVHNTKISNFDGQPFSALISYVDGKYLTFSVQENGTAGYDFVVGQLYMENRTLPYVYQELIRGDPEPLYVNYQWAELDADKGHLYVLMGNENTPDKLNARIYIYDIQYSKFLQKVELQVDQFAFMNMHYYAKTGKFYALSPGMFFMAKYRPYWQLIEIDPVSGEVKPVYVNLGYYYYKGTYGGSVFHGLDQKTGILYHVLPMMETEADMIIGVDINTKNVTRSQITNLGYVYDLTLTQK